MSGARISVAAGIIIGLLASCVQSLGLTIQRKEPCSESSFARGLWLLGFTIFISSNILGSLFQIASLPVVILAPLGAVSLLWNAFFARLLLGDVFSPWMILGTLLIAGGAVLIAYFGIVPEPTHSLEDLLVLFRRPAFVAYFSLLGFAVVVCLAVTHICEFSYKRRLRDLPISPSLSPLFLSTNSSTDLTTERTPLLDRKPLRSPASSTSSPREVAIVHVRPSRTPLFLSLSYASTSGILSGMCLLFAKSGVELLLLTIGGDNQFWRWQAWMLLLGLVAFALLQLWYLHKALILADPTIVCPLAFCFYNLSSIVNGLVYFDQISLLPTSHLLLVITGIVILLGGVWVVSFHAGPGVDVGTWNEDEEEQDETVVVESIQPIIVIEEPLQLSSSALPVPQQEARIRHGPVQLERQTVSESMAHPHDRIPSTPPLSPVADGHAPAGSMLLSPGSARARRRRPTIGAEHTLSPPPTTGFSIGLSPVSPGFALVPRERRRRVSGNTSASGSRWGDLVRRMQMRRTVSEGDVNADVRDSDRRVEDGRLRDEERGVQEGGWNPKGRWRWLRRHLVMYGSAILLQDGNAWKVSELFGVWFGILDAVKPSPAIAVSPSGVPEAAMLARRPSGVQASGGVPVPGGAKKATPEGTATTSSALGTTKRTGSVLSVRSIATSRSVRTVSAEAHTAAGAVVVQIPAKTLSTSTCPPPSPTTQQLGSPRSDKASRILGIQHRRSMEPIPASTRTSIVSTRSARDAPAPTPFTPSLPLTSLYVVSGLPKAPHTWTLADPDSILGLAHTEGAVNRWWRAEVLGSTVSPGAGGGKKKKRGKGEIEILKGAGALSKHEVAKMLSKALKLSFTREVEIIASTLQPASTVHTFSFTLPAPSTPLHPSSSSALLRSSVLTTTTASEMRPNSTSGSLYPYYDPYLNARPSSAYLGPAGLFPPGTSSSAGAPGTSGGNGTANEGPGSTVTYHGVCLTVWSHADAERSAAIRRTLEAGRSRKESAQSLVTARLKNLRADAAGASGADPTLQARRSARRSARGPWGANGLSTDADTDMDVETDGAMSESDFEVASTVNGHNPGESTLFLPGDTVFWLPYALTLVSRHPVYDLMRDYLTLSWARFSKDVQSHTLQISKILSHPAPRAGDLIKLDASATVKTDGGAGPSSPDTSLEVIARFPGGLDFGRGLVDINFTMWPLFKALNLDHILTICEIALAPTGRVLFFSRHPAMLGIAVSTIKYLVELRGWSGIALQAVHSRDAKIYIDDPGPWIMGLATEARYSVRPVPEVCICDLDINYLNCASPPPGIVSTKQQREKYRQKLLAAIDSPHYHPDHSVPSEFKEAFPAGRFRPVCKIQAKRGASSAAVADTIKPPEWWHSTRIIQAFDAVLQDKFKKPSLLKRISSFGAVRSPPQLTVAEQHIQLSIRKRATAFCRRARRPRDEDRTAVQAVELLDDGKRPVEGQINREQRETRRLSGLVTMTAVEKTKLQNQLKDTEHAHKDALVELQKMRDTMEAMEIERAAMVAEVEAQIEKALASMAVDIDDSDYSDSRSASRVSSRRPSDAASRNKQLRSFGTESTLAESYDGHTDDDVVVKTDLTKGPVIEEAEEELEQEAPMSPSKKKRFSVHATEHRDDGMTAVDEGISERSDKIARKVLEIQQKLESALADRSERSWKNQSSQESESDLSEAKLSGSVRSRSSKGTKLIGRPPSKAARNRSRTASSAGRKSSGRHSDVSDATIDKKNGAVRSRKPSTGQQSISLRHSSSGTRTPTNAGADAPGEIPDEHLASEGEPQDEPGALRKIASGVSLSAMRPVSPPVLIPSTPALTPALTGTTDDSDTDFQSAYSTSPRESYGDFDQGGQPSSLPSSDFHRSEEFGVRAPGSFPTVKGRERVSSVATTVTGEGAQPSPTFSEDTIVSQARGVAAGIQ
ncbi:hypothetical protein EW146_g15 [Bondarzewia mesenterica]|uniref:cDENN domain-containing protein n=1 Tax=Bondarzewia mesenterica TaxID=1095465 RepID=A0A4S4MAI4_9AGAM|nr:hypothetical protein EW146_g15 [Bondarzewia mesenterica]